MCGQKNRQVFAVQLAQKIPHLSSGKRVHSGSRLIEEKDLRVRQKCTADHQFALHTAGKFADGTLTEFKQVTELQKFFCSLPDLLARHEIKPSLIFHDLVHGHILAHGILLSDHADLAFQIRTVSLQCLAIDQDLPFCGKEQGG